MRFYFQTNSSDNNYPGWFFDDVSVVGTEAGYFALDPASGSIPEGEQQEVAGRFDAGGRWAALDRALLSIVLVNSSARRPSSPTTNAGASGWCSRRYASVTEPEVIRWPLGRSSRASWTR